MNKHDLRYIKTEELIIDAFLKCAEKYEFRNIHIKDICSEARISRNAFYAHYQDKYELLSQIYADTRKNILSELTPEIVYNIANNAMHSGSEWCIRTVYENKERLRLLAKCSPEMFRDLVREAFINSSLSAIYDNIDIIQQEIELRMSLVYITDALTSILLVWLEDTNVLSAENCWKLLHELSRDSVEIFYGKLDQHKKIRRKVNV